MLECVPRVNQTSHRNQECPLRGEDMNLTEEDDKGVMKLRKFLREKT